MFGPIEIPNKSSFKINEVCGLTGVKSYVLRFWESEFEEIAPLVSTTGQKLYEHRDIEAILMIKKLLFEDKLTIERAKAEMKNLMPRESLVEEGFSEAEVDLDESDFFTEEEKNFYPQRERETNHIAAPKENFAKRVLIESDFQKLMMAKSKLVEILDLTESIKQKKNWR